MQTALANRGEGGKVSHDVPEEILDEYEQLSDKKLAHPSKFAALGLLRKAWKLDPRPGTWDLGRGTQESRIWNLGTKSEIQNLGSKSGVWNPEPGT